MQRYAHRHDCLYVHLPFLRFTDIGVALLLAISIRRTIGLGLRRLQLSHAHLQLVDIVSQRKFICS